MYVEICHNILDTHETLQNAQASIKPRRTLKGAISNITLLVYLTTHQSEYFVYDLFFLMFGAVLPRSISAG